MRVGIVACGYADGYPRHARMAPDLVDGQRTQTLGRVPWLLYVDLSNLARLMWQSRGAMGRGMPIEAVAHAAVTVSYG